jgi:hypothetical protein
LTRPSKSAIWIWRALPNGVNGIVNTPSGFSLLLGVFLTSATLPI